MADASLDDELLAAVGVGRSGSSRIPHSSRSSSKRGRHGGSSEDEDYEDEPSEFKRDSDDDEGDDSDNDKSGNRKGTGSKVPLKKRLDKDDDDGSGDGYVSDLSYGSDLIKDDEDRERLDRMTELDREMTLLERSERREAYLKRKSSAARQKKEGVGGGGSGSSLGKQKDMLTPPSSSRMRSSTRDSQRNVNKHALNKLISARRQKAHESDQRRNNSTMRSSPRRKSREGSSSPSLPEDDSSDEDRKYRNRRKDSDGGESDDDQTDLKLEDVMSITIRRSKLAKWFLEPFFEEIIQNCFVRVGVGIKDNHSIYRLCQVKNVDARDPDKQYKFENRMTHKWLNLVWGNSEARWQMARISDQPPTQNEFNQWCREVDKSNSRKPTLTDVTEKREAIAKLSTFVYSADLVKKMLHEKKLSLARPSNVAAEKDRLLKELAIAESKDDQFEVERIQRRLKELEAYSIQSQSKDAKALALAQMNKRNRYENFKNASELKPVAHAKQGEAGYDPFSRRWTRSQNYYDKSSKSNNDGQKSAEALEAEKAQEAAADAGKLTDTCAPVDDETKLFSLHDFHLPISLSGMQKLNNFHHAYITRKQRLEATCGVPVEGSDGRRHMLTLTVNDYKRRRGLL